jgi:hypothetical protein
MKKILIKKSMKNCKEIFSADKIRGGAYGKLNPYTFGISLFVNEGVIIFLIILN